MLQTETKPEPTDRVPPLLVSAEDLGRMLGTSERSIWAWNSSGQLGPLPIRLSRCARWRVAEIEAWLAAGAPERSRWQTIQKQLTT